MRIFVNNVDGHLAGAICADLFKLSKNLVGTRKGLQDDLLPPTVKRLVWGRRASFLVEISRAVWAPKVTMERLLRGAEELKGSRDVGRWWGFGRI